LLSQLVGSVKSWESSADLLSALKLEIRDGQLSFRGKRILGHGCGCRLAGTFTCLKVGYRANLAATCSF
ncbi:hypothetical protein B296_00030585, partial [Ensete ventricosum]